MTGFASRRRRCAAGIGLWAGCACAAVAHASGPETQAASAYEPGFMLLSVLGILGAAGLIFRVLVRLRLVSRVTWMMPILILLTGLVGLSVRLSGLEGFSNLRALFLFLFSFLLLLLLLYPVARMVLPSRAQLTRGGVPPLLRGVAMVLLAFVGMFILLTWSFPGLSLTPMFVTSGVVSVVLGFALQDLLSNLVAGIVLNIEQSFKVGDWIRVGETEGEIVELTWRAVCVRTRESDMILIPNNLAARQEVRNFDRPTGDHVVKIQVGVAYDTPCGLVTAVLIEAAGGVEDVLRSPAPAVFLKDFGDSSMNYELWAWIDNYGSLQGIESALRKQIWYAFKRHGIVIPFPQRDVYCYPVAEVPRERSARLVAVSGPLRGAMFPLGGETVTIGRNPDCSVVISDHHISGQHAVLESREDGYHLKDLGSLHGTLLNGRPVREARLEQGDEMRIGPVALVYENHSIPTSIVAQHRSTPAAPVPAGVGERPATGGAAAPS